MVPVTKMTTLNPLTPGGAGDSATSLDRGGVGSVPRMTPRAPEAVGQTSTSLLPRRDSVSQSPMADLTDRVLKDVFSETFASYLSEDANRSLPARGVGEFQTGAANRLAINALPGMLSAYRQENPELSGEELMEGFYEFAGTLIGRSFDQAQTTLDYVQQGKGDFQEALDIAYHRTIRTLENFGDYATF